MCGTHLYCGRRWHEVSAGEDGGAFSAPHAYQEDRLATTVASGWTEKCVAGRTLRVISMLLHGAFHHGMFACMPRALRAWFFFALLSMPRLGSLLSLRRHLSAAIQ